MPSLHTGPLEGGVQVGVPVVPEIDHAEQGLEDRLLLVIPAGGADGHDGYVAFKDHARSERVAWAGVRTDLVGLRLIQPELLAADAHADSRVAEDHGAGNPSARRCGVEEIAVLIDDGYMRGVFGDAAGVATERE